MVDEPSTFASRRAVVTAGVVSIASVTGCSALPSDRSMLGLALLNHADSPYTVEMSLFRVGNNQSRDDVRAYSTSIDVEPRGEARREEAIESKQYLVRYDVYRNDNRRTDQDHVHFYPDEGGDGDRLAFDIHSPGVMTRRA